MYIEPSTNIRILKNVPLDNTYTNTIFFDDATAQANYFMGKQKHNMANYTYQRVNKGVARIGIVADRLYDCNYMMFQNTSYGNKWFYAFITKVEYLNNVTSEITFEIDHIQSWLLDCTMRECLIEREHTISDDIGEHLECEPFEITQYVTQKVDKVPSIFDTYGLIIQCSANVDGFSYTGAGIYEGVFSGVNYYFFNIDGENGINRVNEFLNALVDIPDGNNSIVAMYMIPYFVGYDVRTEPVPLTTACSSYDKTWHGDYTPKNNKMYTSPFNVLYIHSGDDEGNTYSYEYLYQQPNGNYEFKLFNSAIANPQIFLVPTRYLGVTDNFQHRVVMDGFPQCAFTTDSYKQYIANQGSAPALKTVSSVMTAGLGASALVTGGTSLAVVGGIGALIGGVNSIANMFNQLNIEKNKPPVNKGSQSSAVLVGHRKKNFYFEQRVPSRDDVRKIDNYFTKYGYATNRLGTPILKARKVWTYVKTIDCLITGGAPASAIKSITESFNRGITFWVNGDNVGDYSLDNSVL